MPKKKSSKLKNMTDEERVLYLEQKMLAEQEERKKQEDLMNQVLRSKMVKEVKFTRNNMNKINFQWLFLMRDIKAKDLQKDIEIMSQTFERIIDRKDSVIKQLLKDLQESEEQFAMMMRSYFERTDFLVEIQAEQLGTMKNKCLKEIGIIKMEFDKEREFIMERHQVGIDELSTIIFGMEKIFFDQESEANIEYLSVRDDIKIRNLEDKQQLRVGLESRISDLWNQFNHVMTNYEENNGQRKRSFDELKEKDAKSAKEIDMQMRKINGLLEKIEQQKSKIILNAQESISTNNLIKEKREEMNNCFQELKFELKTLQSETRKDLTKLTLKSDEIITILKKKEDKARSILKLAEMCRVLETEEEKILPFTGTSMTNDEKEELKKSLSEHSDNDLIKAMTGNEFIKLDNFWNHYNKALVDKLSLEKERKMLSLENNQLRIILKQYLEGISVNEEVMNHTNPLLIVNNRTNVRVGFSANRNSGKSIPDSYHKVVIEAKNHIKNTIY